MKITTTFSDPSCLRPPTCKLKCNVQEIAGEFVYVPRVIISCVSGHPLLSGHLSKSRKPLITSDLPAVAVTFCEIPTSHFLLSPALFNGKEDAMYHTVQQILTLCMALSFLLRFASFLWHKKR